MRSPDFFLDEISYLRRSALLPGLPGLSSSEGVGHRILPLRDEGEKRVIDSRIERRCLIVVEPAAGQRIGALLDPLFAFHFPLLVGIVVGERRTVEGRLE